MTSDIVPALLRLEKNPGVSTKWGNNQFSPKDFEKKFFLEVNSDYYQYVLWKNRGVLF